MATAEQMQEALQQIELLTTRIATLETQLQFESARAQTAEQERSTLIQTVGTMRMDRGDAMVDTERNRTALHSERNFRPGLRRVDPQSADIHAYKVRR